MIQFPETAQTEWSVIADAANADRELRKRIEQGTEVERAVDRLRVNHDAKILFQQELEAEATPTLIIGTLADYLAQPNSAPVDMIEGVMKERGVCVVLGPSGAGKTTLTLQMIHSVLTGDDWLGQPVHQINGAVGLLSYDQDASISVNWMSRAGVGLDRVSVVNANGMGNPLGVPKFRRQIAAAWSAAKVEVVVIDSFSASFVGMDQNDAGATMAYYRDMKTFALTEVGAKVLVVIVHSTESNPLKPRGSTVHKDVADSMVVVTVNKEMNREVQMVKYREGLGQQKMSKVICGPPDAVTHLVSLDTGAMVMENLPIPPSIAGSLFPEAPDSINAPQPQDSTDPDFWVPDDELMPGSDTESTTDSEKEDDL